MKKKFIILIPIIILLVVFIYKACLLLYFRDLNNYSYDYRSELSKIEIGNMNITNKKMDNTIKYHNLSISIPKEFHEITLEDDLSDAKRFISGKDSKNYNTMIMLLKSSICFKKQESEDKRIQTIGYDKLLKKYNIKTENDLIKYYFNESTKNTLLTSKDNIKMNYLSLICVKNSNIMHDTYSSNIYFLEGDITGIYVNSKDKYYEANIYNEKDDEYYYVFVLKYKKSKVIKS